MKSVHVNGRIEAITVHIVAAKEDLAAFDKTTNTDGFPFPFAHLICEGCGEELIFRQGKPIVTETIKTDDGDTEFRFSVSYNQVPHH